MLETIRAGDTPLALAHLSARAAYVANHHSSCEYSAGKKYAKPKTKIAKAMARKAKARQIRETTPVSVRVPQACKSSRPLRQETRKRTCIANTQGCGSDGVIAGG